MKCVGTCMIDSKGKRAQKMITYRRSPFFQSSQKQTTVSSVPGEQRELRKKFLPVVQNDIGSE